MSATVKPSSPARTKERRALAAAQELLRAAEEEAERTSGALSRLEGDLYDRLIPGVPAAQAELEAARARQPHFLVAAALDEEGDPDELSVADAETALALAERRLADVRSAIRLIRGEAQRANDAVDAVKHALDNAVKAVVGADPARAALAAAYVAAARRTLRLGRALKSAGVDTGVVDAHGQRLFLVSIPVVIGAASAFVPDESWRAVIELLKSDPNAPLPDLPPPDPDIDVDGGAAAAA